MGQRVKLSGWEGGSSRRWYTQRVFTGGDLSARYYKGA